MSTSPLSPDTATALFAALPTTLKPLARELYAKRSTQKQRRAAIRAAASLRGQAIIAADNQIMAAIAAADKRRTQLLRDRLDHAPYPAEPRNRIVDLRNCPDREPRLAAARAALVPPTWCGEIDGRVGPPDLHYQHNVRWADSGYCKRHNYPERAWDILIISVPLNQLPSVSVSADRREITIGPWTWRKNAGHSLSIRYASQGIEADRAAFIASDNVERRQAITVAVGDAILDLLDAQLIQADDYGRLYDCRAIGRGSRMVRVECPSTDRIYWLSVPPTCRTALEAVAATFGLHEEQYAPEVQA